ncbi:YbfB/YjiJ family MFS transporter [Moraxella porci]|uniref:YbfB/YjiJ family MFS transporter n=1 Tax=Moraxella porci TaxID=1288392 RepID=UPI00244B941D|nr:YbfB/YjiJ family MFS transporter [Moraxella porci]MDH2272638.1 YbfB/YjiJ family MFS transporter [Moraxella porci]
MAMRSTLKNGLEAALMLAVVMGFGRFAYTALYPYMVNEQILDIEQGSWAAAANYLGYLIGAIWAIRIKLNQAHQWALVALLGTAITLGALYLTDSGMLIIGIRLLAGVFSAVGIVATSMWLLGQRQKLNAAPIMYAGVGLGIAASAQLVAVMSERWLSPQIWLLLALVALAVTALVIHGLFFEQNQNSSVSASVAATNSRLDAQALPVLYGLAGFGYIITATYLPLLITLAVASADIEFVWTAFGLSVIPSCFIWYQICQRLGTRMSLVLNMLMQAIGVILPVVAPYTTGYMLSALLVGGGFMGTVTLVMPIAKQLTAKTGKNLITIATVAYSIGQILGPIVSAQLYRWTQGFEMSLLLAMIALLMGAMIAWKKG